MAETRTVYFYGPITSSNDTSTTKLTSDLFYSQLENLSGYTLVDNRNIPWQEDFINEINDANTILFYVEIQENIQEWKCTLTAIDAVSKKRISKTDSFDGYYKILMEAKNSLLVLLDEYASQTVNEISQTVPQTYSSKVTLSLDTLSGTWKGDNQISQIVILRGGRGFVIYKNGASMNIQVSIKDEKIFALQTSRSNASFFPDLPREVALIMANDAQPIEWILSLIDKDTLSGQKFTLMPMGTSAERQAVNVTWKRSQ